jgi:hypothetical protein
MLVLTILVSENERILSLKPDVDGRSSKKKLVRTVAAAIRTWVPESAPQPREELSTRK